MMDYDEIKRCLGDFEEKYDVYRYLFEGWSVWSLLRHSVTHALVRKDSLPVPPKHASKIMSRRERIIETAKDLLFLVRPRRYRSTLVVTCSSVHTESALGKAKDWLFDDYCGSFKNLVKLERINNRSFFEHHGKQFIPRQLSDCGFHALTRFSRVGSLSDREKSDVAELSGQIESEFQIDGCSEKELEQRLSNFARSKKVWGFICKRLKANLIVCDDGYYQHGLIAGAKEMGCGVIELQHGAFVPSGPEYGWPSQAYKYRETIPLPDRLFLFGEHSKEMLDRDDFWRERIRVIGSSRIDAYRFDSESTVKSSSGPVRILFTSQGICAEQVVLFLKDFMRLFQPWRDVQLVIRLHPAFDFHPEIYRDGFVGDSRVTIMDSKGAESVYGSLKAADLHLSVSSTCHFDALALGTPSVVLAFPSHEIMSDLWERGHAGFARTPIDLYDYARAIVGQRAPRELSDFYYKSGAKRNFEHEVSEYFRNQRSTVVA